MILAAFDFWPFSMAPGFGFLGVFVLLAIVFLGGARLAQSLFGRSGAPERSTGGASSSTSVGLTIGMLPREGDAIAVAYLRGGKTALIETLLASALSSGWLHEKEKNAALIADARPKNPPERLLLDEIGRRPASIEGAIDGARRTADRLENELRAQLEVAGLLRSGTNRLLMRALPLAAMCTLWLFAAARIVVREAHYGAAPFPAYLSMALVAVTIAGVALAVHTSPITPYGRRYLSFLEDASAALRADVRGHRAEDTAGVPLTVALDGLRALSWLPLATAFVAYTSPTPTSPSSIVSSDGSSSSGASSCGSSSCGSSCGGGGGCS